MTADRADAADGWNRRGRAWRHERQHKDGLAAGARGPASALFSARRAGDGERAIHGERGTAEFINESRGAKPGKRRKTVEMFTKLGQSTPYAGAVQSRSRGICPGAARRG